VPSAAAKRYAKAVYEVAAAEGRVDEWQERLQTLEELFSIDEVESVLDNPVIPSQRRVEVVDVLDEGRLGTEARNLGKLLVESGRPDLVHDVREEFEELADEEAGRVRATITTAVELSDEERRRLTGSLSDRLGRELRSQWQVDPSILGGVILQLGDRLIDASLRGRLDQLRRRLAGA
jgi:F-type H+-transporting ATPase subunit delta